MTQRRTAMFATLMVLIALVVSGCIRTIPKPGTQVPGTGVKLSGVVTFKNTGLPIYNATVKVGDKLATTNGYGAFSISGISPGQYDVLVITAAGEHEERVNLTKDSTLNVKINEPYGFNSYVFVELSQIDKNGITRWGPNATIRYYFVGGEENQHALFEEALANFLHSTELHGNVLTATRTNSRLDANVIVEWEKLSENMMTKVDPTIKDGRITYVNIKIYDMDEIKNKRLPYQVAVARMLGLSGETKTDRNSVLWHESARLDGPEMNKTASTIDKASIMMIYSLEPGFQAKVQ